MITKIIITIGHKTESPEIIKKLIEAGVDMFRFNFSHATYDQFTKVSKVIRKIAKELKKDVKIIQDLQGPRIRVDKLPKEGFALKDGTEVGFTTGETDLANNLIKIDNKNLHLEMRKGDNLFLANGEMALKVISTKNNTIWCVVTRGGVLLSHKGINVPDTTLKEGGLTPKDIKDVKFALENKIDIDYIAMSFVQNYQDVTALKSIIKKNKKTKTEIGVISKIERAVALADIDKIIIESDAIMFARGDLGIEVPVENLPIIQKNIIRHSHWHNTPIIIATQVLTSMINNLNPTRAEVSDIANAIFDRADAIMLSDETAVGVYPVETVKMLKKVIVKTEDYLNQKNFFNNDIHHSQKNQYARPNPDR